MATQKMRNRMLSIDVLEDEDIARQGFLPGLPNLSSESLSNKLPVPTNSLLAQLNLKSRNAASRPPKLLGPYLVGRVIGRGASAKVREALCSITLRSVAVKVLPIDHRHLMHTLNHSSSHSVLSEQPKNSARSAIQAHWMSPVARNANRKSDYIHTNSRSSSQNRSQSANREKKSVSTSEDNEKERGNDDSDANQNGECGNSTSRVENGQSRQLLLLQKEFFVLGALRHRNCIRLLAAFAKVRLISSKNATDGTSYFSRSLVGQKDAGATEIRTLLQPPDHYRYILGGYARTPTTQSRLLGSVGETIHEEDSDPKYMTTKYADPITSSDTIPFYEAEKTLKQHQKTCNASLDPESEDFGAAPTNETDNTTWEDESHDPEQMESSSKSGSSSGLVESRSNSSYSGSKSSFTSNESEEQETKFVVEKQYLVLEYCVTSINDLLDRHWRLPAAQARCYFAQLMCGLAYLHGAHVIHRDIKPANLLLTLDHTLKISDFGVAEFLSPYLHVQRCSSFAGTRVYLAPEAIMGGTVVNHHHTHAPEGELLDVWAAGITLYNMAIGGFPFVSGATQRAYIRKFFSKEVVQKILGKDSEQNGKNLAQQEVLIDGDDRKEELDKMLSDFYEQACAAELTFPSGTSGDVESVLRGMLRRDPRRRLRVAAVRSQPYTRFAPSTCGATPEAKAKLFAKFVSLLVEEDDPASEKTSSEQIQVEAKRDTPNSAGSPTKDLHHKNAILGIVRQVRHKAGPPVQGEPAHPNANTPKQRPLRDHQPYSMFPIIERMYPELLQSKISTNSTVDAKTSAAGFNTDGRGCSKSAKETRQVLSFAACATNSYSSLAATSGWRLPRSSISFQAQPNISSSAQTIIPPAPAPPMPASPSPRARSPTQLLSRMRHKSAQPQ